MRNRIVFLCALLALVPIAPSPGGGEASAQTFGVRREVYEVPPSMVGRHNGECKRITRQIARYAEVADMAKERGDEHWEQGTLDHIARLSTRRAQLCPTLYAQKPIGQELAKILKGAAKIAMKLFTMGLI
jgi:hypothetical protein